MAESTIKITVIANVAQSVKELQKVTSSLERMKNVADEVAEPISTIRGQLNGTGESAKGASKGLDEAGESAKSSGNKAKQSESFWSKLGRSLKRIFLYRTIRKLLSEIGQSAREGIDNIYEWSSAVGSFDTNNTKTNLDSLSSSVLYLSNAIGASLSSAFDAILPHINNFIKAIARAFNTLSMFFSALMGKDTYIYAVEDVFDSWDTKAGSASKSAKELRRILLGFDEINRLDMETDTSGGGGGGTATETNDMFDRGDVTEKMKKIAEEAKKLIPIIGAVAVAFGTWKISSKIVPAIDGIKNALKLLGGAKGFGVFLLGANFIYTTVEAFKKAFEENENFRNGVELMYSIVAPFLEGIGEMAQDIAGFFAQMLPEPVRTWLEQQVEKLTSNWYERFLWLTPGINLIYASFQMIGWLMEKTGITTEDVFNGVSGAMDNLTLKLETRFAEIESFINAHVLPPLRNFLDVFDRVMNTNLSSKIQDLTYATNIVNKKTNGKHSFATGGFPATGELFIARENGLPEMVGNIGGQTAVANNEQIVEAIKRGVFEAMVSSGSTNNGGQSITLNVDGKQLFDIMVDRNNSQVRRTGKSALLV